MDPSESANVLQYMKLFGRPPPGITPQNLQLIQALQAARASQPAAAVPVAPRSVYAHGTPGVTGALQDAIGAVAPAVAPQSIVRRPQVVAAQEAAAQ